jgi:L-threonylcarbamoyladenylate synthase
MEQVAEYFGDALDGLLEAPLGGLQRPTGIRDALSGAIIRA